MFKCHEQNEINVCVYVCMCICVCAYAYVCVYARAHVRKYTSYDIVYKLVTLKLHPWNIML